MKIFVTQVFVDDQEKALEFYTKVLVTHEGYSTAVFDDTCGNLIQIVKLANED